MSFDEIFDLTAGVYFHFYLYIYNTPEDIFEDKLVYLVT